jgi:3-dehydroquinate dehydratase type I
VPRICVSIQALTTKHVIENISSVNLADLIEIRLDYNTEKLDLAAIRGSTVKPLIATNRRSDQGGKAEEQESERVQLLLEAVEAGFEYVDISTTTEKLTENISTFKKKGAKVIVSYHDFQNPLNRDQLEEKHNKLSATGCDIVKIIGWTNDISDNIPYLGYNREHPGNISFGMGEKGITSRILAPLSGAAFTYASLKSGMELAEGQIPLDKLWETYRSIG